MVRHQDDDDDYAVVVAVHGGGGEGVAVGGAQVVDEKGPEELDQHQYWDHHRPQ